MRNLKHRYRVIADKLVAVWVGVWYGVARTQVIDRTGLWCGQGLVVEAWPRAWIVYMRGLLYKQSIELVNDETHFVALYYNK